MMALLALVAPLAACASHAPWGHAVEAPADATPVRRVDIAIGEHGFEPKLVDATAGENLELVFTRRVEHTCVTRVIVSLDGDRRLERDLPLDQPVAVRLTVDRPGELGFSCPMAMYGGTIRVRDQASTSAGFMPPP